MGTLSRPANAAAADPEVPRQADEGLEELATMAYHLMKAAGGLVQNMDPEVGYTLSGQVCGKLRSRVGRNEITSTADQEARACDRTRCKIHVYCCS